MPRRLPTGRQIQLTDDCRVRLNTFIMAGVRRFTYRYVSGDDWEHVVPVEDLVPPDPNQPPIVCLAGANACPPEDVGGSYGYADFLKILAGSSHEEYADTLAWAGGAFDLQATNQILKTIRPRPSRWPRPDAYDSANLLS